MRIFKSVRLNEPIIQYQLFINGMKNLNEIESRLILVETNLIVD